MQAPTILLACLFAAVQVQGQRPWPWVTSSWGQGTAPSPSPSISTVTDPSTLDEKSIADSDWQIFRAKDKNEAKQFNLRLKFALEGFLKGNGKGNSSGVAAKFWKDFKNKHGKTFKGGKDEDDAKKNFFNDLDFITKFNDDDSNDYWLGPNAYSEYSMDTLKSRMLMKVAPKRTVSKSIQYNDTAPIASRKLKWVTGYPVLPTGRDWKARDKVPPVKDQGLCAVESSYMITYGLKVSLLFGVTINLPISLSEQQLLDCENPAYGGYSQGCDGGYSDAAIEYAWKTGQTTDDRYLYKGARGSCNTGQLQLGNFIKLGGTEAVFYPKQNDPLALMQAVDRQPVVVYVEANALFTKYSGGTFNPTSTQCGTAVNHAVVVVGYWWSGDWLGSYWIIQNSWGTSWGDGGYMRMAIQPPGPGPCGMYQYPMAPSLSPFAVSLTTSLTSLLLSGK